MATGRKQQIVFFHKRHARINYMRVMAVWTACKSISLWSLQAPLRKLLKTRSAYEEAFKALSCNMVYGESLGL